MDRHFVAYHSQRVMGTPFGSERGPLKFYASTRKRKVLNEACGNTVWVIEGEPDGHHTKYTLRGVYWPTTVSDSSDGDCVIGGATGKVFDPPVPLDQLKWFIDLRKRLQNFRFGFSELRERESINALLSLSNSPGKDTAPPSATQEATPQAIATISEGTPAMRLHIAHERDPVARRRCLETKGYKCEICGFDFEERYGTVGTKFAEVHHLIPLSAGERKYSDPRDELIVVCSNCHSMIHRRKEPYSPEEIRAMLRSADGD